MGFMLCSSIGCDRDHRFATILSSFVHDASGMFLTLHIVNIAKLTPTTII